MHVKVYPQSGITDNRIFVEGFTLNDFLSLYRDPEQPNEAVTKRYVDKMSASFDTSKIVGDTIPKALLVQSISGDVVGFNRTDVFLKNMGITPGTYSKVVVDAKGRVTGVDSQSQLTAQLPFADILDKPTTVVGYLGTSADYAHKDNGASSSVAMSGNVLLSADPTAGTHAATQQYVQSEIDAMDLKVQVGTFKISTPALAGPNFLRANGGVLSKAAYPALHAILGDSPAVDPSEALGFMGQPWRHLYAFNQSVNTTGLTWSTSGNLFEPLWGSQAVVTKNRVYLIGGVLGDGSYTNRIYTAVINSDGTLGAWTKTALTYPTPIAAHAAVVTKKRLYVLGGNTGSGVYTNATYYAPINEDGTLGDWVAGPNLPDASCGSSTVVTRNRIYLMGAALSASNYTGNVYTATISADGTIGAWSATTALPGPLVSSSSMLLKSRVYLMGGATNASTFVSTVYTAPVNADGTLGAWTTATALPGAMAFSSCVATRWRIYLYGGTASGNNSQITIYSAPYNADSTIGTWGLATSLPSVGMSFSQPVVTNSRVFLLGGYTTGRVASGTVYTTGFAGGLNDYMTLIADNTYNSTTQFRLPDYSAQTNGVLEYFICAVG